MSGKASFGLDAIETVPLHEVVFNRITRALMSGQIQQGVKLTSRKLAKELGTSDMPVRSALTRLQALRALEQLPNGSMIVPAMSKERFSDLMSTRILVEGRAAELAGTHMTKQTLRALRVTSQSLTQAALDHDIDAYLTQNYEFKFQIYTVCGSKSLLFLIETLWLQVGPFLRQFGEQFDGRLSDILELDFHEEIVEALEAGDGKTAGELIKRDVNAGAEQLLKAAVFSDS